MRIVQSFWSNNRSLMQDGFGWLSPQFHLMAWTLSSLKLNEYYNDLHLYTDSNSIPILIEYLNLPYRTVSTPYDHINHYHQNLWAMPKILTYAVQDEPFLHVDGDVFIWERFETDLEHAGLVAQNPETGTYYYKMLMNNVRKHLTYVPDFLDLELKKESIPAYNMGIFGGSDIAFIKKYCNAALELININYHNTGAHSVSVNFNLLFEQILLHSLCSLEKKKVACLYNRPFEDNGYSINEFCDFTSVPANLRYLHLIGDKKRHKDTCISMSRTLFTEYPDYFYKIVSLFKNEHLHFAGKIKPLIKVIRAEIFFTASSNVSESLLSEDRKLTLDDSVTLKLKKTSNEPIKEIHSVPYSEALQFKDQLTELRNRWKDIQTSELLAMENDSVNNWGFCFRSGCEQLANVFARNCYLRIFEESFDWKSEVKKFINKDLVEDPSENLGIACIPQLFFEGYSEILIDELEYNILTLLEEPLTIQEIVSSLRILIGSPDVEDNKILYQLVQIKLKRLILKKSVFIKKIG